MVLISAVDYTLVDGFPSAVLPVVLHHSSPVFSMEEYTPALRSSDTSAVPQDEHPAVVYNLVYHVWDDPLDALHRSSRVDLFLPAVLTYFLSVDSFLSPVR